MGLSNLSYKGWIILYWKKALSCLLQYIHIPFIYLLSVNFTQKKPNYLHVITSAFTVGCRMPASGYQPGLQNPSQEGPVPSGQNLSGLLYLAQRGLTEKVDACLLTTYTSLWLRGIPTIIAQNFPLLSPPHPAPTSAFPTDFTRKVEFPSRKQLCRSEPSWLLAVDPAFRSTEQDRTLAFPHEHIIL